MRSHRTILAVLAAVGTVSVSAPSFAQTNPAPLTIDQRIENLEQEIQTLKRQREQDRQAAADAKSKQPPMPVITAGANGFGFKSADEAFAVRVLDALHDGRTAVRQHDGVNVS